MLLVPVVFEYKALLPEAVLLSPVVFEYKVAEPVAVLLLPSEIEYKAPDPTAMLPSTVSTVIPILAVFTEIAAA